MRSPWPCIERISALLEPAERQSVLGDIEERGPNTRALLDLIGLVLLRQLQGLRAWRTWLVFAAMLLPLFWLTTVPTSMGTFARRYPWSSPDHVTIGALMGWAAILTFILAWSTGYALGAVARHRAGSVLCLAAIFAMWVSRPPMQDALWFLFLVLLPSAHGILWGLRGIQLRARLAIVVAILSALSAGLSLPAAAGGSLWRVNAIPILACLWPVVYALRPRHAGKTTNDYVIHNV